MHLPPPLVLGQTLPFHPGAVAGLCFLDEDRVLSWSRAEAGVRVWTIGAASCEDPLFPTLALGEGAVALDPARTRIAAAAGRRGVQVQAPTPPALAETIPVPGAEVRAVAFRDPQRVLGGDAHGGVWLADLAPGGPVAAVALVAPSKDLGVRTLATHRELPILLVVRAGENARLHDLERSATLRLRSGDFREGGFLEDDEAAWFLRSDGALFMIPLDRRPNTMPTMQVAAAATDPWTLGVLAIDLQGALQVVLANGPSRPLGWTVPTEPGPLQLSISPSGGRVALGYGSGEVVLRERHRGEPLATPPRLDSASPLGFAGDGRLVAGLRGRRALRWDLGTHPAAPESQGPVVPVQAIGVATSGERVAYIEAARLRVVGWTTPEPRTLGLTQGHAWTRWSPAGDRLATGGGRTLSLWSLAPGGPAAHASLGRDANLASWSPDGTLLALAGRGPEVRFLETERLQVVDARPTSVHPVGAFAWHPDGRHLFLLGERRGLEVLDRNTGAPCVTLPEHPGGGTMAVSPDGRWLACGGPQGASLLELDATPRGPRPRRVATLEGVAGEPEAIAFSQDGRRVAVSEGTPCIRTWRLG